MMDSAASTPRGPFDAQLETAADKHQVAQIFIQIFRKCIPDGSTYKGSRRWKAGYNRMVALAYVVAPELFFGMTQAQVALELRISERQFFTLRSEIESSLAMRALTARERAERAKLPKCPPIACNPIIGTGDKPRVLPGVPCP